MATVSGDGTPQVQPYTASGDGIMVHEGSGTPVIQDFQADGDAWVYDVLADGDPSLSDFTVVSDGCVCIAGVGAGTIAPFTATGAGELFSLIGASGSPQIQPFTADGLGEQVFAVEVPTTVFKHHISLRDAKAIVSGPGPFLYVVLGRDAQQVTMVDVSALNRIFIQGESKKLGSTLVSIQSTSQYVYVTTRGPDPKLFRLSNSNAFDVLEEVDLDPNAEPELLVLDEAADAVFVSGANGVIQVRQASNISTLIAGVPFDMYSPHRGYVERRRDQEKDDNANFSEEKYFLYVFDVATAKMGVGLYTKQTDTRFTPTVSRTSFSLVERVDAPHVHGPISTYRAPCDRTYEERGRVNEDTWLSTDDNKFIQLGDGSYVLLES